MTKRFPLAFLLFFSAAAAGAVRLDEREEKPPPELSEEGRNVVAGYERDLRRRGGKGVDPRSVLENLLKTDPRAAVDWIGRLAAELGKYSGPSGNGPNPAGTERDLWETYVLRNMDDPRGYEGLGRSSSDLEDYGGSIAAYTKAIELGAATPENFNGRGLSAERLGDFQLAHADAAMALRMDPANARAVSLFKLTSNRVSKAVIDKATGEILPPDAARGAPPAVEAGPDDAGLPVVAPGRGAPDETADPARRSAALTEAAARAIRVGDFAGALRAAGEAARLNPNNAAALNFLATAHDRRGEHMDAVAFANKALAIEPGSVPALNTRAWALSGLRDFKGALADADRITAARPANAFGHVNLGRALGGLGRRGEMVDSLARGAALDGRFAGLAEAARQLPSSADTELLFAGLMDGGPAPGGTGKRDKGFLRLIALLVSGGFLFALGLAGAFSPSARRSVSNRVARILKRGGNGSSGEAPAALATEGPIASYEVKGIIATGGMGVVYEAVDRGLDRRVAIKKMRGEIAADPRQRERFIKEARTVAALRHPNIVQIHSIVDEDDLYLIFEFVEGKTLKDIVAAGGPLDFSQALTVIKSAADALAFAHGKGVVHRDLKLENLMITEEGKIKLMDFGLARQAPPSGRTAASTIWGTPSHMAPEAENGEVLPQSDLYSLGVVLYELVTGKTPFSGSPGSMFVAKTKSDFRLPREENPKLPGALDAFMLKALDPDPKRRHQSPGEFWEELKRLSQ